MSWVMKSAASRDPRKVRSSAARATVGMVWVMTRIGYSARYRTGIWCIRVIRRSFPKGTNFDEVTKEQVEEAERWINNYPRKLLGWKSASDLFNEEQRAA